MLARAGNLRNLRIAAGLDEGDFSGYRFADSDVYKWLEAVGWELGRARDVVLQDMADLESHDQPEDVDLLDVRVVTSEPPASTAVDILGGIVSLSLPGRVPTSTWADSLYRPLDELSPAESHAVQLTAIPYFLWGNRGMKSMRVWLPHDHPFAAFF